MHEVLEDIAAQAILAISEDNTGGVTDDTRDAVLYRVQLEDGTKTDGRGAISGHSEVSF